jgi:hypothetical protein
MDTMSRQIATGQKVASVKDDGAAWARAAELKSQKVNEAFRLEALARIDVGLQETQAQMDSRVELLQQFKALAEQARALPVGSASRQALQAEWTALLQGGAVYNVARSVFDNNDGWGNEADGIPGIGVRFTGTGDGFLENQRWAVAVQGGNWFTTFGAPERPVRVSDVNLVTANDAAIDDALQSINSMLGLGTNPMGWSVGWAIQTGADRRMVEDISDITHRNMDRLDASIGALTDADMGKASTARAQAETRQQLALQTVQQAISAYGNYANGLLGNVQRTQRGIMA